MLSFFAVDELIIMLLLSTKKICHASALQPFYAQETLPKHVHGINCHSTSAEPVQIICLLDCSASMEALTKDTIENYNSFLENLRKKSGKVEITTVLFSDDCEMLVKAIDLDRVPNLTSREYSTHGATALLDAVGSTIIETANRLEKNHICPAKRRVLFLIMTDGEENTSKRFGMDAVKEIVENATNDYGWNFIFLGANIDAVSVASTLGIKSQHAMDYAYSSAGIQQSFSYMYAASSEVREKGGLSEKWKDNCQKFENPNIIMGRNK